MGRARVPVDSAGITFSRREYPGMAVGAGDADGIGRWIAALQADHKRGQLAADRSRLAFAVPMDQHSWAGGVTHFLLLRWLDSNKGEGGWH